MKNMAGLLLVLSTVACGPRISQWVQVTDCAKKHVVVPGVVVRINEGATGVGLPAEGGDTDAQGNTWGSFPVDYGANIQVATRDAYARKSTAAYDSSPTVQVPANPQRPVFACINR